MDALMKNLEASLERIILNPKYHDPLMLVKAVRNGILYGTKVRFPHALVMIFLFRSGTFRQKVWLIYKATRLHARNLALFALTYKSTILALNATNGGKERQFDTFLAGLTGGYFVFGRSIHSSVSQQIVIYVAARVCLAVAKLIVRPKAGPGVSAAESGWGLVTDPKIKDLLERNAWPAFASLSWACVMYIFRWHPESIQPSLRSSMTYIYVNSDHWDSLRNFIW